MLLQMTERLRKAGTFDGAIHTILNDVVALHGAEYGSLQLIAGEDLLLVAHRGFAPDFLETFRRVSRNQGCVCGRALRLGKTVVVPDIETDADFAPFRDIARIAGFRAVQSTPISGPDGTLIGVVSTHFANPHHPTAIEMQTLAAYQSVVAEQLLELRGTGSLPEKARQMNDKLYSTPAAARTPVADLRPEACIGTAGSIA